MKAELTISTLGTANDRHPPHKKCKRTALAVCLILLAALTVGCRPSPASPSVTSTEPPSATAPAPDENWENVNAPYVIVKLLDITDETRGFVSSADMYKYQYHRGITCEVLFVNSTEGMESGPYHSDTRAHLIRIMKTVDIWFPPSWIPSLKEGQTILFKLTNAHMGSNYYYVPAYYTAEETIPVIFFEDEKMILTDELSYLPFSALQALQEKEAFFKEHHPDLDYASVTIQNGMTVEETIAYFNLWKEIYYE